MKTTLLTFVLLIFSVNSISQDYSGLDKIKLKKAEDFKNYEEKVLAVAEYLLSGPTDENADNKIYCNRFLFRWMVGAEYSFEIGDDYSNFTKKRDELGSIYFAAMIKAAITNDAEKVEADDIVKDAKEIFIDYCANPSNNVKPNKAIKVAIEERG